jgi:hypothetical protein
MTNLISQEQAFASRKAVVSKEFDRLIKELIARRVLRKSMLGGGFYVIYTEDGPMDITLKRLAPCLKLYPGSCYCQDCDDLPDGVCEQCAGDGWVYKRVDVDAEKRVPCECGIGAPND